MRIEVQLEKTSQPIVYDNALNAYTKGAMYCVLFEKDGQRTTHKYPVDHLFRAIEDYSDSKRVTVYNEAKQ